MWLQTILWVVVVCLHSTPHVWADKRDKECAAEKLLVRKLRSSGAKSYMISRSPIEIELNVCARNASAAVPMTKTCCTESLAVLVSRVSDRELHSKINSLIFSKISTVVQNVERLMGVWLQHFDEDTRSILREKVEKHYNCGGQCLINFQEALLPSSKVVLAGTRIDVEKEAKTTLRKLVGHIGPLSRHGCNQGERPSFSYAGCLLDSAPNVLDSDLEPHVLRFANALARVYSVMGLVNHFVSTIRHVMAQVSDLQFSSACHRAFWRARYCKNCAGVPEAQPCDSMCMNMVTGCWFPMQEKLGSVWQEVVTHVMTFLQAAKQHDVLIDEFVPLLMDVVTDSTDAFRKRTAKPEDDLKVESVISGAAEVATGDQDKTGKRGSKKKKDKSDRGKVLENEESRVSGRETRSAHDSSKQCQRSCQPAYVIQPRYALTKAGQLKNTLSKIRRFLHETTDLFDQIPVTVCKTSSGKFNSHRDTECWNGSSVGTYGLATMVNFEAHEQRYNPEVPYSPSDVPARTARALDDTRIWLQAQVQFAKQLADIGSVGAEGWVAYHALHFGHKPPTAAPSSLPPEDTSDDEDLVEWSGSGSHEDDSTQGVTNATTAAPTILNYTQPEIYVEESSTHVGESSRTTHISTPSPSVKTRSIDPTPTGAESAGVVYSATASLLVSALITIRLL